MKAGRAAFALLLGLAVATPASASPPYANDLERLSEIMGSLQLLSELCDLSDVDWRSEMTALIEASEPDEATRLRLADRYNLGYSAFAISYRRCTAAAIAAIERYRALGAALIASLAEAFPASGGSVVEPEG